MLQRCSPRARPNKTVLAAATVEFLGRDVSAHGLLPMKQKCWPYKHDLNPPVPRSFAGCWLHSSVTDVVCQISKP
eukprot:1149081-Pelagomonas_calceolata.AAC.7